MSESANTRRWMFVTLCALTFVGAGGAWYWWPRPAAVPMIATENLDAEVAEVIVKARDDVVARPRSADAWGQLGMALFAQDMYPQCIGILAEAERLDPADVRWCYLRGLALVYNHPQDGIAVLEQAARQATSSLTIRLRLAEEYVKLERLDDAEPLFREVLAMQPGNPRALLGIGIVSSRRGNWAAAIAPLTEAAQNPMSRRSARIALAEAYMRLGDAAEADNQRRGADAAGPDVQWPDEILLEARRFRTGLQPRIDEARALINARQLDEAAALLNQVLRDHPDSAEARLTLAKVLIHAGAIADAQKELKRALALNDHLADAHVLLAGTLMIQKNYEAAQRSYARAIELKPADGHAHYNLGTCWLKLGDRARALASWRAAVVAQPDLGLAQRDLGALLLEDGKRADAIVHLENAVRLDGNDAHAVELLERARKNP